MAATLASLERMIGHMPDRNNATINGDGLRPFLVTATTMILNHTGMLLSTEEQTFLFDTVSDYRPTAGALAVDDYNRSPLPTFTLPVSGPLDGLRVQYRGAEAYDDEFDWEEVDDLVSPTDYIYEPSLGMIRLMFRTANLVHGLRVTLTTESSSFPEILSGADRQSFMASMGLVTDFTPAGSMFTGVLMKGAAACASAAFTAPGAATFVFTPPTLTALHRVRLSGPRDGTVLASGQATTVTLEGVPSSGPADMLDTVHSSYPLPQTTYELKGSGVFVYPSYRIAIGGLNADTARLSFVDAEFSHHSWRHMDGGVPEALSEACAMLAAFLYKKEGLDGTGKEADRTGRSYATTSGIPGDIRMMLQPYSRRGGGGVLFI